MTRNHVRLAAVGLCAFLALGASLALSGDESSQKPPKLDGKELFKTSCKSCHLPGSSHGEYTPMSLIVEQWERFFDQKFAESHAALVDSTRDGKPLGDSLSPAALKAIRHFCVEHAADSEHPMTCG